MPLDFPDPPRRPRQPKQPKKGSGGGGGPRTVGMAILLVVGPGAVMLGSFGYALYAHIVG